MKQKIIEAVEHVGWSALVGAAAFIAAVSIMPDGEAGWVHFLAAAGAAAVSAARKEAANELDGGGS